MKLIVVPKNISKGVFDSQIIPLLIHSEASALFFKNKSQKSELLKEYSDIDATFIIGWCEFIKKLFNIKSLYTRDVFDFMSVFIFRTFLVFRIRQVHDFRALISEESYMRHQSKFRKIVLSAFELFSYTFSNSVFCVSNNLRNELHSRFYKKNVTVIPCCISIEELKRSIKISSKEKNSFVYIGSIAAWQMFEESILMYKSLPIDDKTLTVFTKDVLAAKQLLDKHSIKARVESVDRKYIVNNLKNFSFGFVLRSDSIVNRTASPIKFMEYAANGVIPITTNFVGDYSELFAKNICNLDGSESEVAIKNKLECLFSQDNLDSLLVRASNFTWQNYKTLLFG